MCLDPLLLDYIWTCVTNNRNFVSAEQIQKEDTIVSPLPVVQLTEIQVTEAVDSMGCDRLMPDMTDPYPDKTPISILGREYSILTQTLNTTDIAFYPFELLMQDQTIKDYLKMFHFLRAGVKLRILFLTNPNQYGCVGVSCLPYMQDSTLFATVKQQSQSNMHLLDLTEQTALEMDLPYLSPELYFNLSQTRLETPSYVPRYWRVIIHPFEIATVTVGAPTTVQVRVMASLTDVTTAGFIPNPAKVAEFQSGPFTRGDWFRAGTNLATNLATSAATMAYAHSQGMFKQAVEGGVESAADMAKEKVQNLMGGAEANKQSAKSQKIKPSSGAKVKMDVVPDISGVGGHDDASSAVLGDNLQCAHTFLPSLRNITDLRDIFCRPMFLQKNVLTNVGDNFVIQCDPFVDGSYAAYIAPMFKYYRSDFRIFCRIVCSALTRTRLRFTVFPVGTTDFTPAATFGDTITELVTVAGPSEWTVQVPYLQQTPWIEPIDPTRLIPSVQVLLDAPIPQIFDKVASISIITFVAPANAYFAGLQSFLPGAVPTPPEPIAEFQSIDEAFSKIKPFGITPAFRYMGGVTDAMEVMRRFGSRRPSAVAGDANLFYPFPQKFVNTSKVENYDNYDYINQLYLFYTGGSNIKLLFSKAPATGVIKVAIQNSRVLAGTSGDDFRSGNSVTMTHQAVWPVLEYYYPYQNEVEFDSVWFPSAMYSHKISQEAILSEFLISPANDFQVFYLLPVPVVPAPAALQSCPQGWDTSCALHDFIQKYGVTVDSDDVPVAEFQSRASGANSCSVFGTVASGNTGATILLPFTTAGWNAGYQLFITCNRTSGSTDQSFVVELATSTTTAAVTAGAVAMSAVTITSVPITWKDLTNNGLFVAKGQSQGIYISSSASNLYVNIRAYGAAVTSSFDFLATVQQCSVTQMTTLWNAAAATNTASVSAFSTFPVTIGGSTVTLSTNVLNVPHMISDTGSVVSVSNIPHVILDSYGGADSLPVTTKPDYPVEIWAGVPCDVNVTNEVSVEQPLEVTFSGTSDPVRVQGVVDPDTPVFVSFYN